MKITNLQENHHQHLNSWFFNKATLPGSPPGLGDTRANTKLKLASVKLKPHKEFFPGGVNQGVGPAWRRSITNSSQSKLWMI